MVSTLVSVCETGHGLPTMVWFSINIIELKIKKTIAKSKLWLMIKKAFLRVIIREYLNMWWFVLLIVDVYFIIYLLLCVLSLVLSTCARNNQDLNKMHSFIFFNFCFKEVNFCIGVGLHKNKAINWRYYSEIVLNLLFF